MLTALREQTAKLMQGGTKVRFIWRDSLSGKPSTSKLWTHISYGTSTYIILHMENVSWEILLVYMAVVGGSEIAKKLLTLKFGVENNSSDSTNKS